MVGGGSTAPHSVGLAPQANCSQKARFVLDEFKKEERGSLYFFISLHQLSAVPCGNEEQFGILGTTEILVVCEVVFI